MTIIRQDDVIRSVADALQYISFYHPVDLHRQSRARLRARAVARRQGRHRANPHQLPHVRRGPSSHLPGHRHRQRLRQNRHGRPLGRHHDRRSRWSTKACAAPSSTPTICSAPSSSPTRPASARTPATTLRPWSRRLVPGDKVDVDVAAKGGGSEAKSKFVMLNPSDSVVDWVVKTVPTMGAGWCPPGMLGIGIGGTAEKAMIMAKEVAHGTDQHARTDRARGPAELARRDAHRTLQPINALGIGAQGLGGLTTVLDVKIREYPTHAANLPVAMIPNCAATRHCPFVLDGSGPVALDAAVARRLAQAHLRADQRPPRQSRHRHPREMRTWKPGEVMLLSGKLLTGRDAAHKRMTDMLNRGEKAPRRLHQPLHLLRRPGQPVREEAVGPAGPTTATRMDKFTRQMLEADRSARHDRQSRARAGSHRSHPRQPRRLPHRRRRRGLPRLQGHPSRRASSPLTTSAWKPSTSSMSRTCPSPSPSTRSAPASTPPAPPSGNPA